MPWKCKSNQNNLPNNPNDGCSLCNFLLPDKLLKGCQTNGGYYSLGSGKSSAKLGHGDLLVRKDNELAR